MRVSLSGPIVPGAWTVLIRCAASSPCGSVLPGDVNGDGTTGAVDVLALIDALNYVALRPLYAADINRSGLDDPVDILVLIDLLERRGGLQTRTGTACPKCSRSEFSVGLQYGRKEESGAGSLRMTSIHRTTLLTPLLLKDPGRRRSAACTLQHSLTESS